MTLLWVSTAEAADTQIELRAQLEADLQSVHGHLRLTGAPVELVDPLAQLPLPEDDVLVRRTFPRGVQRGRAYHTPPVHGHASFTSVLPERYGAAGTVRGRGLFANGLWHPQPVVNGSPAVVHWDVTIDIPEGGVGVLNGTVGRGQLHWEGDAERLSLAVVQNGRVVPLNLEVGEVLLVERGPRRPRREARLTEAVHGAWQGPDAPRLVVVDTPSRRRLTRTGPRTLYLSDRAFRVSLGLWRFHLAAVQKGLLEAGLPLTDPYERELAAAALAKAAEPALDIEQMLGWWSWIPEIDALLYDGRLPFYSDVFTETWPGDPIADDLSEMLAPSTPGQAICARLDIRHGKGTCEKLAWKVIQGKDIAAAAQELGLDSAQLAQWKPIPSPQRLWVEVDADRQSATVHRDLAHATESGRIPTGTALPAEPITIQVDDETHLWEAPAGKSSQSFDLPAPSSTIVVDPEKAVLQDSRSDDRWPTRWVPVAAVFPTELSITNRRLSAYASVALRRQYSTRWVFVGNVGTNPVNLVESSVGAVYAFGPLQDRRARPYRVWFGAGPSLLDPDFRPVQGQGLEGGAYAGVTRDTVVGGIFPISGHTMRLRAAGGAIPGGNGWWAAGGSVSGVRGLSGRTAAAGRTSLDFASGGVPHRLIPLGGGSALQAVTPQAVVGEQRWLANGELRWQPIRFASVPGPLVWLSHVQLSGGLEVGKLRASGSDCQPHDVCDWNAVGWTGGLLFTGDVLGVRPTLLGATVAGPLVLSHAALAPDRRPQVYVRLTQAL